MTDVNLGDVVEVLDPLYSPTVYQLRSAICFVVVPSVQCRRVFVFLSTLFLHPWLFDDPSVIGCSFFLPLDRSTVVR